MFEASARIFVLVLEAYALLGLVFALLFVVIGIARIDAQAQGTSIAFRLIILPGSVALWPLLAWRWVRGIREAPIEHNPHRIQAP